METELTLDTPDDRPSELADAEPTTDEPARRAILDALALVHRRRHGSLGTCQRGRHEGPFGSVVPFTLDAEGRPLMYLATISEHSRNLKACPQASLLVYDEPEDHQDVQERARVCLVGHAELVPEEERGEAWERYQGRLPAARAYARTHDFELWRLVPRRIRWIGGFGAIRWLSAALWRELLETDPLRDRPEVIEHMNEDHLDAVQEFYRAYRGEVPQDVRMVGLDRFGMRFTSERGPLRVEFDEPADLESVRPAVVGALHAARARIAHLAES